MNIVVSSDEILSKLRLLSIVGNKKNIVPILDNTMFIIDDGLILHLRTTDLETDVTVRVEAGCVGEGSFLVNTRDLVALLSELKGEALSIKYDQSTVSILTTNGEYELQAESSEDFPNVIDIEVKSFLNVSERTMLTALESVSFAVSSDPLRPVMNGVYFDADKTLCVVATDGYVLSKYECTDYFGNTCFILPIKAAMALRSVLRESDNTVNINVGERHVSISFEDYRFDILLIEGKYLNYNSVFPDKQPYSVSINRGDFLKSVKRASVMSNKNTGSIKLCIDDTITIEANDFDLSKKGKERLKANTIGDKIGIGFRKEFLIDVLGALKSEYALMEYSANNKAVTFIDNNLTILLMPLATIW